MTTANLTSSGSDPGVERSPPSEPLFPATVALVPSVLLCGLALLVALPPMAVYGVAQYFAPAKWDADWLTNIQLVDPGLASIGNPLPNKSRVFSAMNSPGSFAVCALVGILVAPQHRVEFALPLVALMALALLLTLYRAVWAGTLLKLVYLALAGITGTRLRIIVSTVAVLLLMTSSALFPQIRQAIAQRIDTISHLQSVGVIFVGEPGFLVWLFLGLAPANAHLGRQAERSVMRGKEALLARLNAAASPKGALRGV